MEDSLCDRNRIEGGRAFGGELVHEPHHTRVDRGGRDRPGNVVSGMAHISPAEGLTGEPKLVFEETHARTPSIVVELAGELPPVSSMPHWLAFSKLAAVSVGTGVYLAAPFATGALARARRSFVNQFTYSSSSSSVLSTETKADWGISTFPTIFIFRLPSFCFSRSLRLRLMSPP